MRAVAEADRVPGGEIVVAANEGSCLHILPEVFAEFKRSYPDVGITVERSETREVIRSRSSTIPPTSASPPCPSPTNASPPFPSTRTNWSLITPVGHPLAKFSEINVTQIADYPLAAAQDGAHPRQHRPACSISAT